MHRRYVDAQEHGGTLHALPVMADACSDLASAQIANAAFASRDDCAGALTLAATSSGAWATRLFSAVGNSQSLVKAISILRDNVLPCVTHFSALFR
jgi:hypothetical protein